MVDPAPHNFKGFLLCVVLWGLILGYHLYNNPENKDITLVICTGAAVYGYIGIIHAIAVIRK